MDAARFDRLAKSLPAFATRRGLLGLLAVPAALGGLSSLLVEDATEAASHRKRRRARRRVRTGRRKDKRQKRAMRPTVTLCHDHQTITVAERDEQAHLDHGDTRGRCAPTTIACRPGSFNFQVQGLGPFFCAQSFIVPYTGHLTAAQCDIGHGSEGDELVFEIRALDPQGAFSGEPLAQATVFNAGTSPGLQTLKADFDPPAPVTAEQGYALVISVAENVGLTCVLTAEGGCQGEFRVEDDSEWGLWGGDMMYAVTIAT